ncbi:CBS domain-containing protein [Candidatus Azambacteria bacterium]|nr:CBS domain-containing protein [Candidatus Azambacteria bacterium]
MTVKNIKIENVMRKPHIVKDTATFFDVVSAMISNHTNSIIVVDKDGKLAGEVSVLNLLKEVIPPYISDENEVMAHFVTEDVFHEDIEKVKNVPVSKFMVVDPPIVTINDTLVEAAIKAISSERSRVVVVDALNKPIGVLTRTEIKQVIGKHLNAEGCFPDY